jgi:bacteriorhodopsin
MEKKMSNQNQSKHEFLMSLAEFLIFMAIGYSVCFLLSFIGMGTVSAIIFTLVFVPFKLMEACE